MDKEIEQLISYAINEGYLSDVDGWTDKQKENYYNRCMAFEPDEDVKVEELKGYGGYMLVDKE